MNQRPESRGLQGQGQPWSPRRGRANRKMTKALRQWRGQKIDFVFLFLFLFCWARLTVHGCRIGMGPSHKPSVKMCVCVCVCVCVCLNILSTTRDLGWAGGRGPHRPFLRVGSSHPWGRKTAGEQLPPRLERGEGERGWGLWARTHAPS